MGTCKTSCKKRKEESNRLKFITTWNKELMNMHISNNNHNINGVQVKQSCNIWGMFSNLYLKARIVCFQQKLHFIFYLIKKNS